MRKAERDTIFKQLYAELEDLRTLERVATKLMILEKESQGWRPISMVPPSYSFIRGGFAVWTNGAPLWIEAEYDGKVVGGTSTFGAMQFRWVARLESIGRSRFNPTHFLPRQPF
jgi:hypothetical protein